ncbi:hypothetical protein [Brevundimonas sp.]|uniref:hypothetical protein n=1 Tax=Brevundimonas sp. TaxID=1871086 RepID=UPI0035B1FA78
MLLTDDELNRLTPGQQRFYRDLPDDAAKTANAAILRRGLATGARPDQSTTNAHTPRPERSLIRQVGFWGFLVCFGCAVIAALASSYDFTWVIVFASFIGLFAPMWLAGVIEDRLIQLISATKNRG